MPVDTRRAAQAYLGGTPGQSEVSPKRRQTIFHERVYPGRKIDLLAFAVADRRELAGYDLNADGRRQTPLAAA